MTSLTIRINKVHYPVTALGPGSRVGIWVQGCSIGCDGCISKDTWPADAGREVAVPELVEELLAVIESDPTLTGLTISGGEPTEQAQAVQEVIESLRDRVKISEGRELDVLLYSGLAWKALNTRFPELVSAVDAVIAEPFVANRAPGPTWAGSANQSLRILTDLGRARFPQTAESEDDRPQLQVVVRDGKLWTVGIPRPDDLERMRALAALRGVEIEDVSWRP